MRKLLENTSANVPSISKPGNLVTSSEPHIVPTSNQELHQFGSLVSSSELASPQDYDQIILNPEQLSIPYATEEVFVSSDDVEDQYVAPLTTRFSAQDLRELDVIDRGVLSLATARILFESYSTDVTALAPLVLIPHGTTADDMRMSKPVLFLAIMAVAAAKHSTALYKTLNSEIRQLFSTTLFTEKSVQLVQALLVTSVWYFPPTSCNQLKVYQYVHLAATMALDLGIGTRPRKNGAGYLWEVKEYVHSGFNDISRVSSRVAELENRRTFLACYIMCSEYESSCL